MPHICYRLCAMSVQYCKKQTFKQYELHKTRAMKGTEQYVINKKDAPNIKSSK